MTTEPTADSSPPPLSEPYHKARRNLALFSGLLIAWEYVGFSLGDEQGVVEATAPGGMALKIRHPEVIPVVVLVLILYFAARLAIEWKQSDEVRRARVASHWDVGLTYFFSGTAIFVFVIQQAWNFQIAAVFTPTTAAVALYAIVLTYFAQWFVLETTKRKPWHWWAGLSVRGQIVVIHMMTFMGLVAGTLGARWLLDLIQGVSRESVYEFVGSTGLGVVVFVIAAHGLASFVYGKFFYTPDLGRWGFTKLLPPKKSGRPQHEERRQDESS